MNQCYSLFLGTRGGEAFTRFLLSGGLFGVEDAGVEGVFDGLGHGEGDAGELGDGVDVGGGKAANRAKGFEELFFAVGSMPGSSSRMEVFMARRRRERLKVMAKRWASSRRRMRIWRALVSRERMRLGRPSPRTISSKCSFRPAMGMCS